jgi:nicotinamide riboside kinase
VPDENGPVVVAVLGAESTGKTTLASALAARIGDETGLRCAWVGEVLREWCERARRTPQAHEQEAIAREQHARIAAAAARHDVVVADTTAVMTAVYSRLIFGDESLVAPAAAWHGAQVRLALLTALDLPWEADGHQRDGPHVREPVDRAVRELLHAHRLPWALVSGQGPARLESALDAVSPLLRARAMPRQDLLTRLATREAAQPAWRWVCDECDVPECEHALLRRASEPPLSAR